VFSTPWAGFEKAPAAPFLPEKFVCLGLRNTFQFGHQRIGINGAEQFVQPVVLPHPENVMGCHTTSRSG
jgi:hypothetical protein